jgi:CDP-diacylglycerol--glycerol-3-phosphate 3-phosphatidyltransferase
VISERIGNMIRGQILGLGRYLANLGLTANMLTVIGLALNGIVAIIIGTGHEVLGGFLLLVASAFDMLDGAVARATGTTSKFGGFLDSTLDRYSESVVYLGVLFLMLDSDDAKTGSVLVLISATGALLISYARARAEAAGYSASVGLVARPERVILLGLCLIIGQPLWALWILAITTHLTAATRIFHVWRLSNQEQQTAAPAAATASPQQNPDQP